MPRKRKSPSETAKKPGVPPPLASRRPETPLDTVAGLRERSRRACQFELEALERRQGTKAHRKTDATLAANLARSVATIAAEDRKSDEDELAAVRLMVSAEKLPILLRWLCEQPALIRREAMLALEASFRPVVTP